MNYTTELGNTVKFALITVRNRSYDNGKTWKEVKTNDN